jgi:prepilin-type N-terminal cleavage/methylation domain-containing protein/prepilin-type processing-associated H-X9-DG protein
MSPIVHLDGSSRTSAFTLIELMAVIGIIGILGGVLLGSVAFAKKKAELVTCIGRERQLGVAFQAYASDNKGRLLQPKNDSSHRWPILIAGYIDLGSVPISNLYQLPLLKCPTQENVVGASGVFGYNQALEQSTAVPVAVPLVTLSNPAGFPVLATSDGAGGGGLRLSRGGPPAKAQGLGYSGKTDTFGPSPNFDTKAVFLFADWHVEARSVCDANQWPWNDPQAFLVH